MVLIRYFFKRFFKYFFLINISLTLLFNLIEFFEKIVRVKHTSLAIISHFVLLNTIPSFFENFFISSWLATCLLIKEIVQQNEWETLQILNVNYKKLFNLFLMAGTILAISSFVGKEKISLNLSNKSEKFKLEKLKLHSQQTMINKWLSLSSNTKDNKSQNLFCYFNFLDLKTNNGAGLLLIYMTPNFEIKQTISCTNFKIDSKEKILYIPQGIDVKIQDGIQEEIQNVQIKIPSFFSQLKLNIRTPTLLFLIQTLISAKNILPKNIWNNLLLQFLKRILVHLQLIIYPLLTFCFFLLFPFHPFYKWILILVPYPLIIFLTAFTDFLVEKSNFIFLVFLPYLILFLIIFLCRKKIEK